jgi:hypothetical protein
MKTFVLWKGNVSIAATLSVAVLIKNSVPISAGITTTTGLTAIQVISLGMFMVYCGRTDVYLLIFTKKGKRRFTRMPFMHSGIISVSLPM